MADTDTQTPPAETQTPPAATADPTPPAEGSAPPASQETTGLQGGDEGGMPDALGGAETEAQQAQAGDTAPEQYEAFRLNDQDVAPEQVEDFVNTARELGLSQEKAQKVFDAIAPTAQKYLSQSLARHAQDWAKALTTDKELGGARYKESMAIAGAGYKQYASDELKTILKASGLSNHPEVVRHFYHLGQQLQQDKGVVGHGSPAPAAIRRYPNSGMVADMG